jgi:hypothetical protein
MPAISRACCAPKPDSNMKSRMRCGLLVFAALVKFDRFEWLVEKVRKRAERRRRIVRESSQPGAPPGSAGSRRTN